MLSPAPGLKIQRQKVETSVPWRGEYQLQGLKKSVDRNKLIIGSRGSKLALWQSEWVREQIRSVDRGVEVDLEIIKTSGDKNLSDPLSVIGGQGVFTKELEDALISRRIDIAVHSLKDLP